VPRIKRYIGSAFPFSGLQPSIASSPAPRASSLKSRHNFITKRFKVKTRRALPGSLAKVGKNQEKQVERPKHFGGSAKMPFWVIKNGVGKEIEQGGCSC
jgi:hypothetical protein